MSAMFEFARVECQDPLIEDVKPILACRVCLSAERPLRSLEPALTILYEQITGITVSPSDIYPKFLCSYCRALLLKFGEFRKKCHSAQQTVLHWHSAGIQITGMLLNSSVTGPPYPHLATTETLLISLSFIKQPAFASTNQQTPSTNGNGILSKNPTEIDVLADKDKVQNAVDNLETSVKTEIDPEECVTTKIDEEISPVPATEDNDADSVCDDTIPATEDKDADSVSDHAVPVTADSDEDSLCDDTVPATADNDADSVCDDTIPAAEDKDADSFSDDTSDLPDCLVGIKSDIYMKDSKKSFKDDLINLSIVNRQSLTNMPKIKTSNTPCKQITKKTKQSYSDKKDCFIKETIEWMKQFKAKKNGAKNTGINQELCCDDIVVDDHDDSDSSNFSIDSVEKEPQTKCLSDINSGQDTLGISSKIDKENEVKVDLKPAQKIDNTKNGGKKGSDKAKKTTPDYSLTIKEIQKFIRSLKKKKSKLQRYHERLKESHSLNCNTTVIKISKEEQIKQLIERKDDPRYKNAKYKCEMCYRGFSIALSYKNHMADHEPKDEGVKFCDVCNSTYPKRHQKRHKHSINYVCNECGFISKTTTQARVHYRTHRGTTYACKVCGKTFNKPTSVYGHMHVAHGGSVECSICGEKFIGQKGLHSHMHLTHKEAVGAVCSSCSVQFHSQSALRRHRPQGGSCDTTHRPCAVCGEGFPTDELLNEHKSTHRDSSFVCEICGKNFHNRVKYRCHVNSHIYGEKQRKRTRPSNSSGKSTASSSLMCEFCGVVKQNPLGLMIHRRSHTRPFQCDYCQKRFSTKISLQNHIYTHMSIPASKRKQHLCCYCSKTFLYVSNRDRHEKMVHLRRRPFTCDHCGNTYQDKFSLHNHINTKHLGMPWPKRIRNQRKKVKK